MQLTRLIYASNHSGATAQAVEEILQSSRINNARDDISGALVVSDEDFMQILEGPRTMVAKCFMRIMMDARHHDIHVLVASDTDERLFTGWNMYAIDANRIPKELITPHLIGQSFRPHMMSSKGICELCRQLSRSNSVRLLKPSPVEEVAARSQPS